MSSFCICKSYSHFFFSKNTCELDIVFTRSVNILTTNELVKLSMLSIAGPMKIISIMKTYVVGAEGLLMNTHNMFSRRNKKNKKKYMVGKSNLPGAMLF